MSAHTHQPRPDESELWATVATATGMERADAFVDLSHLAYDRGDFKEALALCESARDIFMGLDTNLYASRISHVYEGMVWCLTKLERKQECAEAAIEAATFLAGDEPEKYADALRNAGCQLFAAEEYERSKAYHLMAMEIAYVDKSDFDSAIDHHNIGMCHQRLGNHLEAIEYLLKGRELFRAEKKPFQVSRADSLLSNSYWELDNGMESAFRAQKYLDYAQVVRDALSEAWARYQLACALIMLHEYSTAMENLEAAQVIAVRQEEKDWDLIIEIELEMANIYEAEGDSERAEKIRARVHTIAETVEDQK